MVHTESRLIAEARTGGWCSPWKHPLLRGVGRLTVYRLLRTGAIESRKIGGRWRTTDQSVSRFVESTEGSRSGSSGDSEGQGRPGVVG